MPNAAVHKTVDTTITSVTVYRDRALVIRRATLEVDGTPLMLTLKGLPPTLRPESVRVSHQNTVEARIGDVQIRPCQPPPDSTQDLQAQIQALEQQQRTVTDELGTLKLQQNFVKELSQTAVQQFAQALAQQQVDLTQTQSLLDFVGDRYRELATAIATLEQRDRAYAQQLEALRQTLKQRQDASLKGYVVVVQLVSVGSGTLHLDLSYLVDQASWSPQYDLCLTSTETLHLTYFAQVTQTSGEDWSDVQVILSTATPSDTTLARPQLHPWQISVTATPDAQRRGAARAANVAPVYPSLDLSLSGAPGSELPVNPKRRSSEQVETAPTELFAVPVKHRSFIPSDGATHKIVMADATYPCRFQYIAQPKQGNAVYRQAHVTNSPDAPDSTVLLAGDANVFQGNAFVGTTRLDQLAIGQSALLNLGLEDQIKLERRLVQRQVNSLQANAHHQTTFTYQLIVTNLKPHAVHLTLQEPRPVNLSEQVTLQLVSTEPAADQEPHMLEWQAQIPAQTTQEFTYQFIAEHPANMTITGLDDR